MPDSLCHNGGIPVQAQPYASGPGFFIGCLLLGGLTYDELGIEQDLARFDAWGMELFYQQLAGHITQLVLGLVNGRDGGGGCLGYADIVESGYNDILGHGEARTGRQFSYGRWTVCSPSFSW